MHHSTIFIAVVIAACTSVTAQVPTAGGYIDRDTSRKEVIVFVHGLTGDAKDTWTNEKTGAYWPSLLRTDPTFGSANVWVFSYYSPNWNEAQNVEELAIKLGDELRAQDVLKSHERAYFVAHSMGGLITREMLTQQLPSPSNVPLIFFFGTPSAGADLAGVLAAISSNPQFSNLRPFTRESAVASYARRWLATAENPNAGYPQRIWSFCAYEVEPYVAGKLIVNSGSASFLCSTPPRASLANHVSMVKPPDRLSESYQYFVSAYKFSRGPEAKFLSSAKGIPLYSEKTPGLQIDGLELRQAKYTGGPINVGCNKTERGNKKVQLALESSERLVAAKPKFDVLTNVYAGFIESDFGPSGSVNVKYQVIGKKAGALELGCAGRAELGVQYLIEKR